MYTAPQQHPAFAKYCSRPWAIILLGWAGVLEEWLLQTCSWPGPRWCISNVCRLHLAGNSPVVLLGLFLPVQHLALPLRHLCVPVLASRQAGHVGVIELAAVCALQP